MVEGAQPRYFSAKGLPQGATLKALSEWSKSLTNSAQTANHPYNLGLLQEALVSQAKHYMMRH
jgi:DNA polymerase-3 subunit delta'